MTRNDKWNFLMNETEMLECHLFVTLIVYYNFSKREFEKKGKYNGNFKSWRFS